jgi:ATP-dependent Zn protease
MLLFLVMGSTDLRRDISLFVERQQVKARVSIGKLHMVKKQLAVTGG